METKLRKTVRNEVKDVNKNQIKQGVVNTPLLLFYSRNLIYKQKKSFENVQARDNTPTFEF